jgi:hypothetical protein
MIATNSLDAPGPVLRALLDRLEDSRTGRVVDAFQMECPPEKKEEARLMAELNKEGLYDFAGFLPECAVCLKDAPRLSAPFGQHSRLQLYK